MADTILSLSNVHEFIGQEIGLTDWIDINQMQVGIFGEISRWPKWMHCDRQRAESESPYGGTIVHGFFLVSLVTYFDSISGLRPHDGAYSLNYGLGKVRFLTPVVIGDGVCLRDRIGLLKVLDKGKGRRLCTTSHQIEVAGQNEPAAYIEYLSYWYPEKA